MYIAAQKVNTEGCEVPNFVEERSHITEIIDERPRMCIALNSTGTAIFDQRHAVGTFLSRKDTRNKFPDLDLFAQCDFVKNFIAKENTLKLYIND